MAQLRQRTLLNFHFYYSAIPAPCNTFILVNFPRWTHFQIEPSSLLQIYDFANGRWGRKGGWEERGKEGIYPPEMLQKCCLIKFV